MRSTWIVMTCGLITTSCCGFCKEVGQKMEEGSKAARAKEASEREAANKAQEAKRKAEEDAKEADRAKKEAEKSELLARCGSAWFNEWVTTCKELVRENLFQPKTADFPFFGGNEVVDEAKCSRTYASTVESMNAFGATIENRFVCSFDAKKDRVKLVYLGR